MLQKRESAFAKLDHTGASEELVALRRHMFLAHNGFGMLDDTAGIQESHALEMQGASCG